MGIETIRRDAAGSPSVSLRPLLPTTATEHVNVVAHYHRAEIARMAGWRDRIDRTTNWAITIVGAMLFAMLLVLLMLVIESRRYRFFDVYRGRVRRLERSYLDVCDPFSGLAA